MATLGAIQKFGIRRDSRILKDEKSAPVVTFRSARTRSHFADVGETGDVLDKYLGQFVDRVVNQHVPRARDDRRAMRHIVDRRAHRGRSSFR